MIDSAFFRLFLTLIISANEPGSNAIILPPPIQEKRENPKYTKMIIRDSKIMMKGFDVKRSIK